MRNELWYISVWVSEMVNRNQILGLINRLWFSIGGFNSGSYQTIMSSRWLSGSCLFMSFTCFLELIFNHFLCRLDTIADNIITYNTQQIELRSLWIDIWDSPSCITLYRALAILYVGFTRIIYSPSYMPWRKLRVLGDSNFSQRSFFIYNWLDFDFFIN